MQADTFLGMTAETTTLGPRSRQVALVLLAIGLAGLGAGFGLGGMRGDGLAYFLHAYLVNFCFFLSLSLGGLFFVLIQHVTRAGWSVSVRRIAEILAANMLVLAVLFLPIVVPVLLGSSTVYPWNDAEAVTHDPLLEGKAAYLNPVFFGVRCLFYFLGWWSLGRFYLNRSVEQDTSGSPDLTRQMERRSPLALLFFALSVTFVSFDLLMSLTPHWFSTIYGVYFFSGAVVGGLAAIILAAVGLQTCGRLTDSIHTEHYHDLGKLLLAFVIFWGYIAFSQYFLIWYANIPEETGWYLVRQQGSWVGVSLVLLFGHLLIPFFGLLSREVKRRKAALAFWAVWLLVAHWIDLYYLVMPSLGAPSLSMEGETAQLWVVQGALFIGIGGIYLAGLVHTAGQHSLVARKDPRLPEALAFENT